VLERAGRYDAADSVIRTVIEMRRELLGPEHPDYAWSLFNHAQILVKREEWQEAAQRAREVLELRGRSLNDAHPAVATAMQALGIALSRQDSAAAGGYWLRQSLALRQAHLPAGHWLVASGEAVLAEHLVEQGSYLEAEALLLGAERTLVEQLGEAAVPVRDTRYRLVR